VNVGVGAGVGVGVGLDVGDSHGGAREHTHTCTTQSRDYNTTSLCAHVLSNTLLMRWRNQTRVSSTMNDRLVYIPYTWVEEFTDAEY